MQASLSRLAQVALLGAALALVPLFARAEPKAPSEEENADAAFAASYIGKNYDGDLDIEGWDDLGGGLIAAPIFIHQYQREDGDLSRDHQPPARQGSRETRRRITRWSTR